MIFPLECKENMHHPKFLGKVKETQKQGTMELSSTLLNQDLEPNYRPKALCSFPSSLKPSNSQEAFSFQLTVEENTMPPPNIAYVLGILKNSKTSI